MWHTPNFRLQIDCSFGTPPREGDSFTLNVVRTERFQVISILRYEKPIRLPDGTTATHLIHYRRKTK